MMASNRAIAVRAALLVVAACLGATGTAVADGCCDDTWWAPNNSENHDGCQADEIHAGSVSAAEPSVYLWHPVSFNKTPDSDCDCHLDDTDCEYSDVGEDEFSCTWALEKLVGSNWVPSPEGSLSVEEQTQCTTAQFVGTGGCEPDCLYRAKVTIDDTPANGPGGDDAPDYRWSTTVQALLPVITNCRPMVTPYQSGTAGLAVPVIWDATCEPEDHTHVVHLAYVTFREYVIWDGEDDPHDVSHGDQNCFTGTQANPYVEPFCGTAGWFNDLYGFMPVDTTDVKASLCTCYQSLQWKAHWPVRPAGGPDDVSGWTTEIAPTIHECVEKDAQNQWQQRITRDDGLNQYHAIKSPYE